MKKQFCQKCFQQECTCGTEGRRRDFLNQNIFFRLKVELLKESWMKLMMEREGKWEMGGG